MNFINKINYIVIKKTFSSFFCIYYNNILYDFNDIKVDEDLMSNQNMLSICKYNKIVNKFIFIVKFTNGNH